MYIFYVYTPITLSPVLPYENVHGCYDPTLSTVDISILMNNPELPDPDSPIVVDTKKNRPQDISPCAVISNFQDFCLFRTKCTLKNCILKFKGGQLLEPRAGSTSKVKKMFSLNKNSSSNLAVLDFATNVGPADIDKHFSSRAVKLL